MLSLFYLFYSLFWEAFPLKPIKIQKKRNTFFETKQMSRCFPNVNLLFLLTWKFANFKSLENFPNVLKLEKIIMQISKSSKQIKFNFFFYFTYCSERLSENLQHSSYYWEKVSHILKLPFLKSAECTIFSSRCKKVELF